MNLFTGRCILTPLYRGAFPPDPLRRFAPKSYPNIFSRFIGLKPVISGAGQQTGCPLVIEVGTSRPARSRDFWEAKVGKGLERRRGMGRLSPIMWCRGKPACCRSRFAERREIQRKRKYVFLSTVFMILCGVGRIYCHLAGGTKAKCYENDFPHPGGPRRPPGPPRLVPGPLPQQPHRHPVHPPAGRPADPHPRRRAGRRRLPAHRHRRLRRNLVRRRFLGLPGRTHRPGRQLHRQRRLGRVR